MNRRRFLAITAAALVLPGAAAAQTVEWRGQALGAEARITLTGDGDAARAVLARVAGALDRIEALFSLYRPDSALSRLNRAGRLPDPAAEMLAILDLCDRVHRATGGRFDPTVQPLWAALAAGRDGARERARIGWSRVGIAPGAVTLDTGQALTLNGIAQGFATDRIAEMLAGAGFGRALVDIGEFRALGGPWRLGLSDPAFGLLGTRTLTGGAIATSSPGALRLGGQTHILSPTGAPPLWSTVSVEARSAALADALSTALCLAPAGEIPAIARRLPGIGRITLVDRNGELQTL